MWTEITRPQYERSGLRYASDLKDEEWNVIAPYLGACPQTEPVNDFETPTVSIY